MVDTRYRKWSDSFMQGRLKVSLLFAITALATFTALNLSRHPEINSAWLYTNVSQLAILSLCTLLLLSPFAHHTLAPTFLLMSSAITLTPLIWHFSIDHVIKFDVVTWTLVFLAQATLIPTRWHLHLASQLFVLLAVVVAALVPVTPAGLNAPFGDWLFLLFYLLWFCLICDISVLFHEKLQYAEFTSKHFLQAERIHSDHLLRNILPDIIAERLRAGEATIADYHPHTSVLFADIVGFTELSTQLPPNQLVGLLNELFSAFDRLLAHRQIEKIKTIGDAYMAVAGLPTPNPTHLEDIAEFALAMQQALRQFNERHRYPLQLRIGIHCGPVVAGVIGEKKFSYDLWSDTVNIASRMESNGIAGEIQVSPAVYEALNDRYHFTERAPIEIKGIGTMQTYLLKGKR